MASGDASQAGCICTALSQKSRRAVHVSMQKAFANRWSQRKDSAPQKHDTRVVYQPNASPWGNIPVQASKYIYAQNETALGLP